MQEEGASYSTSGPIGLVPRPGYESLACEMEREGLPCTFIETIRTGWWTTCLEILPAKERARGQH